MQLNAVLDFLTQLTQNNTREWFADNKSFYETARQQFKQYVQLLIEQISVFDQSIAGLQAGDCVFRIYRDVRFSKNKLPYKTNMGAYMASGGRKSELAGYYLHIEPGGSFAGGGVYCPQKNVLQAVREEIYAAPEDFEAILHKPDFKAVFPEIYGEKLKTAPRGYDKNWEKIDLLRFKSYTVIRQFADTQVVSSAFMENLLQTYRTQMPFNEYLNEAIESSYNSGM